MVRAILIQLSTISLWFITTLSRKSRLCSDWAKEHTVHITHDWLIVVYAGAEVLFFSYDCPLFDKNEISSPAYLPDIQM